MSNPKSSKSASQLQDEIFNEITKIDKRYLKLITPHENEIAKLKKAQEKETAQVEKKYLTMIKQLNEIDISFPKAVIDKNNIGQY